MSYALCSEAFSVFMKGVAGCYFHRYYYYYYRNFYLNLPLLLHLHTHPLNVSSPSKRILTLTLILTPSPSYLLFISIPPYPTTYPISSHIQLSPQLQIQQALKPELERYRCRGWIGLVDRERGEEGEVSGVGRE